MLEAKTEAEYLMKKWMKKPGVIKQLQLTIGMLAICIMFLLQQLIAQAITIKQLGGDGKKQQGSRVEQQIEKQQSRKPQVTGTQLKRFARNYMTKFFETSNGSFQFIQEHTDPEFFGESIKPQLVARAEQEIESSFKTQDIFLESLNVNDAKAIILGEEKFDKDYQNRRFTVELVINTSNLSVLAIPVFKIE